MLCQVGQVALDIKSENINQECHETPVRTGVGGLARHQYYIQYSVISVEKPISEIALTKEQS